MIRSPPLPDPEPELEECRSIGVPPRGRGGERGDADAGDNAGAGAGYCCEGDVRDGGEFLMSGLKYRWGGDLLYTISCCWSCGDVLRLGLRLAELGFGVLSGG